MTNPSIKFHKRSLYSLNTASVSAPDTAKDDGLLVADDLAQPPLHGRARGRVTDRVSYLH